MAKKVYDIIYNYVRKRLAGQEPKGIVTKLPEADQIEQGMQEVFRTLKSGNLNPVSADKIIKNEDDLAMLLNKIVQDNNRKTEAMKKASEGIDRVFYKMRNNIPLNPDDQAALQGSGFKTALDNFQGFKPKVIQGGRDLTMKTPGGEIPYIEHPTQTIIQGGKEVPVKIPKGIKDDVKEASDDVSSGYSMDDTKYNADVLALNLAERRGFIKEGQDATDMPGKEYSKLYSEAYDYLTKLNFLNRPPRKPKKAAGGLIKAVKALRKKYGKDIIQKGKAPKDKGGRKKLRQMFKDFEERTKKEGGGLAYMLGEPRQAKSMGGVISKLLKALSEKSPFERYKDYLASVKRRAQTEPGKLAPEMGAITAGGIFVNRRMKDLLEAQGEDQKERLLEEFKRDLDKNSFYDDYPELRDKAIENFTKTLFGENKADGGRIGFADGGMSRRTFLKIMAALAAFPVVGKLAKTTKVAKGVKPIITPTRDMPEHFPKIVEKILKEGQVVKKDFVKKTGDVTTYRHPDRPDMELTIEGEGKRIQLDFETDQGMRGGYEFKQGDIIDEPTSQMRGKRGPDEFVEGEVKFKGDSEGNYYKDFEEGIDTGTENLDSFAGIKKQKTSKSKVILNDEGGPIIRVDEDLADGGLAGLLGE